VIPRAAACVGNPPAVPPELLCIPARDETRRIDRWDCAHVLDPWLRRLGRQEALCRGIVGRLAAVFLRLKGHQRLGFARLGDYTRERLGLGAREVQELARVATRLDSLPALAAAFETGVLSWAHVRLLTRMATPDNAAAWVERAAGLTVRELAALVHSARDVARDDDEAIDGEPAMRFRVACPRRVRTAWRQAVELARRIAGEELAAWEAAEGIAAEGLSARPAPEGAMEPSPAPGWSGSGADREAALPSARWLPVADAAPMDIAQLAAGCEELDARALDARMRAGLAAMSRTDWQLGRLLRLFLDLRLERILGFASGAAYVRERLGCSTRKARALVAIERRGFSAPALIEAYREGQLSWLRALTVLPVVSESTARAWLARAAEVTLRRLADEVDWALASRNGLAAVAPPPPDADLAVESRQMCSPGTWAPCDADVAFVGPAAVVALLRAAITAFMRPGDVPWQGLERLLRHVTTEWEGRPRHRDPVFARDGWRCAVPACTSRRNLHDHHLLFRSRGGGNTRDNRVTVCAWHHLHGLHGGRVRAWGRAPARVRWELGVEAGRAPLVRTCGDRYHRTGPRTSLARSAPRTL
jgi:hypothetical protein